MKTPKAVSSLLLIPTLFFSSSLIAQRLPVNLGTAGNFTVLSETGITDVPPSVITGNVGASPITGAAIHLTCAEVIGTISAVDAAGPAPCTLIVPTILSQAIGDFQTAYTDAAGRTIPDFTELGAGNISGLTLIPGLYKWSTGVMADSSGFTLSGGPNAVWIFQISGDLNLANGAHVTLAGGARASNIFWQVGGPTGAILGTTSSFYGTILSAKQVIINTGATFVGRALAATQVTLQSTSGTAPGSSLPIPPTVTSTVPSNLATNVPIGNQLSATFSESMNPATINTSTFTLKNGLTPVSGTVSYSGVTAVFTPASNLLPGTLYTATITTGAQDPAGIALSANYVWSFTTGSSVNMTPPTVISTSPTNGASNVPINTSLAATFSTAMNPSTISASTFLLAQGITSIPGTVTYAGVTAIFTPATALVQGVNYTATITTGAMDLAGNALAANYIWSFTTGTIVDTTPPTVISTVPANGATGVPLNSAVTATFSKVINPLSINTNTFTIKQGNTSIAGNVSYSGITATFTPLANLAPGLLYTATLTTGIMDLTGNSLASNYVWSFTAASTTVASPLTVISTSPGNGATSVPVASNLMVSFSAAVNPVTLNNLTFTLKNGGISIAGTVSSTGNTALFTPLSPLQSGVLYTATLTTGIMDLTGNSLASNYVWSFTTASTTVASPLTVISTSPGNGATSVPVASNLMVSFSAAVNPGTLNNLTFTLKNGGSSVAGNVSSSGNTAFFTPLSALQFSTTYTATVTTGITDLAGNALASNYSWSFTTIGAPPPPPPPLDPMVVFTTPSNGANLVTITTNILAGFNEPMNPLTFTTASFILRVGNTIVPGTVSFNGTVATFTPLNSLLPNTVYSVIITNTVADLFGTLLPANYVWTFTTGSTATQTSICLANFAVLAGSAIVNVGPSAITGDIGVSPGNSITGFPPGTLSGTIHAGDSAAAQAMASAVAAYGDAVSRSLAPVSIAGDIGGQTFTPGLYNSTSSILISAGGLVLDAKGNPNAVFIFQTPVLTTTRASKIVLANEARAYNVFWQVGTSAILGIDSVFQGSILGDQAITLLPGATLNGRISSRTGTITMQSNTITSPLPYLAFGGIVNAADDVAIVAPGSIASIFGNNLASTLTAATTYPLPISLGGTSFQINNQAAPLYMTSCNQANLQIPWETAGKTQVLVTVTTGGSVPSIQQPATIAPLAPGIFSLNQIGTAQGAVQIAPTSTLAGQQGPGARPVKRGEYVAIFCTGLGGVSNQPATGAAASSTPLSVTASVPVVTIGGAPAQVTYSGLAPGFAGLYQVNAIVPAGSLTGSSVNLAISIGGIQSNTVTIAVQ